MTDTTSTYRATLRATKGLTPIVATPTRFPQGILHLVVPVHFMQEATIFLPLILKYSMRQPVNNRLNFKLRSHDSGSFRRTRFHEVLKGGTQFSDASKHISVISQLSVNTLIRLKVYDLS